MSALATVAAEFAAAFETRKREGGEKFLCLKDDSPEWMTDVIRAGHEDGFILPDDWRYRMISDIAAEIDEVLTGDADADLSEASYERIDGLISVYNRDRVDWLASALSRGEYVNDAMREGMAEGHDIFELLAYGMEREYREVWDALASALQEEAENREEEELG